jgi:VWFA-related protein
VPRVLCTVALALAVVPQPAAPPAASPDTLVRVDAFVVDARGRTLDSLGTSDFELREDGAPQTIEAVRFMRAAAGAPREGAHAIESEADEQREASRPGVRLFAIYLDEYHVSAEAAIRARDALLKFVDADLGAGDLLIVMKPLDSLFSIRLSADRDAARQAIAAFEGRKGDYTARTGFEREYMASTPAAMERMRMQVTVSGLNALAVHLGWASPDARKTLMVVSEGLGGAVRRRNVNLPTIDAVIRSANRSNVAVYPIDPREAVDEEEAAGDVLRTAAVETDGVPIANAAALEPGLLRIAGDASGYYLITYRSAKKTDSRFHDVDLRVKRAGARVRTRKGYWALSPDDLLRAEVLARSRAPKPVVPLEPAPHISRLIRPWFGLARGADGKTRVTFVWEPVSRVPGDRTRLRPARLKLVALGKDDTPLFDGTVLPSGPGVFDGGDETPARAVFDAPPGRLRLRMSIEDAGLQVIDSDVREIAVRDLRAPVALGTPEIMRARNARELRTLDADPQAVPVASREFSRTEHLMIRVPAYAPDGRPTVSAKLMSRLGQTMRTLAVAPASDPEGQSQIDLPLAGLAAGDYLIELTATSPAGEAKDLLGFRVTS